ncbi:tRNA pseudouridine synthase A [bacterium HR29]|nr:tRNA pseudouridine synthase A [bacterium HR29]
MALRRFAATVSYDGAAFAGSQLQPNARTVQGVLEEAAQRLFGVPTRVRLAGRTDAGVHARGQVAAWDADTRLDPETIGRALNALLPEDVAVRCVRETDPRFDPRRWARRRSYRYTLLTSPERQPLLRRVAWHVGPGLEVAAMQSAAEALVGRRDFAACSGPLPAGRSSVRTVYRAAWRSEGCCLLFEIEADAFLPQMVRRIVGALVQVGRGRLTAEQFSELLRQATPCSMGPAAPPHGLCLWSVSYDEGYEQ